MAQIDRLLVFRDVVDAGGFAQAAQLRGTVHSTISRQVKELEESLGVLLMTRTTRNKQLTPAGEVVLRYARRIGGSYEEMLNELERQRELVGGELRVQSLVHVGAAIVMPAIDLFSEQFPDVEVSLRFDDGPIEFHKRALDIALTVGIPDVDQLVIKKLCENDVCIVASPELFARTEARLGAPSSPADLLDWPIAAYKSADAFVDTWRYELGGELHTLQVKPHLTVNDGVSLLDAVRRGHGIGYLSRFSVRESLRAGELVEVLPEVRLPSYDPVYLVKANVALSSRRVEVFEACLREIVRGW